MKQECVNIRVFARFRPPMKREDGIDTSTFDLETVEGKSVRIYRDRECQEPLQFNMDMVFQPTIGQSEIFDLVGKNIVEDAIAGYNGTVFVYGQTGSGKTHTLFGELSNDLTNEQRGLIPRSCEMLFTSIEQNSNIVEATVKCSFIQIYNEKLQDLLNPENTPKLRQAGRNLHTSKVFLQNCSEEYVQSFQDVYRLLLLGFRNRAVASTKMNQQSSRSHCVLILYIKQTLQDGSIKYSKLNFADLAGSENVKKSEAKGQVLKEATFINSSLTSLGICISALSDASKNNDGNNNEDETRKYIPYRDSKLTWLLKDSLGGNTKTNLIVACSKENYNLEETISTLRFATRAKQIKNNVNINKQLSKAELKAQLNVYKKKIRVSYATLAKMYKLVSLLNSSKFSRSPKSTDRVNEYLQTLANITGFDWNAILEYSSSINDNMQGKDNLSLSPLTSNVNIGVMDHVHTSDSALQTSENESKTGKPPIIQITLDDNDNDNDNDNDMEHDDDISITFMKHQDTDTNTKDMAMDGVAKSVEHDSTADIDDADSAIVDNFDTIKQLRSALESKELEIQNLKNELQKSKEQTYFQKEIACDQRRASTILFDKLQTTQTILQALRTSPTMNSANVGDSNINHTTEIDDQINIAIDVTDEILNIAANHTSADIVDNDNNGNSHNNDHEKDNTTQNDDNMSKSKEMLLHNIIRRWQTPKTTRSLNFAFSKGNGGSADFNGAEEMEQIEQKLNDKCHENEILVLEKEQLDSSNKQLLKWNEELQEKVSELESYIETNLKNETILKTEADSLKQQFEKIQQMWETDNENNENENETTVTATPYNSPMVSRSQSNSIMRHYSKSVDSPIVAFDTNDIGNNDDPLSLWRIKALQTTEVVQSLQEKLRQLPNMNLIGGKDMIEAGLQSISNLLKYTKDTQNDISKHLEKKQIIEKSKKRHNNNNNTDLHALNEENAFNHSKSIGKQLEAMKLENKRLMNKLSDMQSTWVAHLDLLIDNSETNPNTPVNQIPALNNKFDFHNWNSTPTKKYNKNSSKSATIDSKSQSKPSKFAKPIPNGKSVLSNNSKFTFGNVVGKLSNAINSYFGQIAILRGSLYFANNSRQITLPELNNIQFCEFNRLYFVLTKSDMMGYNTQTESETATEDPVIQISLNNVISVLRIDDVIAALAVDTPENDNTTLGKVLMDASIDDTTTTTTTTTTNTREIYDNDLKNSKPKSFRRTSSARMNSTVMDRMGMFILTTLQQKYIFKAEGRLSRDVWIENIQSIINKFANKFNISK